MAVVRRGDEIALPCGCVFRAEADQMVAVRECLSSQLRRAATMEPTGWL